MSDKTFKEKYLNNSVVKTDNDSSKISKKKGPFWVVIGHNGCLLSSNVVVDIEEGDMEMSNKTDNRFYDKTEAFKFAETLTLKTPGESYYVLESIAHVVIAPAQVKFNLY